MSPVPGAALALLLGYVVGALPFGLLIGRWFGKVDLREHGSGRIGTTNALRTLGPRFAAVVLVLDFAKGVVAVLVTRALLSSEGGETGEWIAAGAATAAVIGHIFSVFIGLRGGRGVATTAGGLLALSPLALALVAPPALVLMWRSRYVSLGSVVGALLAPGAVAALMAADLAMAPHLAYATVTSVIVLVAHRDNLARLRAGTERKIGQREVHGDA